MTILIIFAFLGGIVTILSPCILPILPIILSTSTTGGKSRPFGIVTGFVLSFTAFTLLLTTIVNLTGLSADLLRNAAITLLLLFGVFMLFPNLQKWLEPLLEKVSLLGQKNGNGQGFSGGFLIGISLGLVWTPCVGPIMASIIALAATSQVTFQAIFITLAYSLGTALPMFLIIYGGRGLIQKVPFLLKNSGRIQQVFGLLMIAMALLLYTGIERKFQAYVLEKFPQYGAFISNIEDNEVVKSVLNNNQSNKPIASLTCDNEFAHAPEIIPTGEWLNTTPLSIEELKGKVVLVDFWTYTCINCIRTLPYLNDWHKKYADQGLVIIGVHTPEFAFEKELQNVQKAVDDFDIKYPVVQDNDYETWRAYENRYWPAKYFVDKNGCIRDTHFGEGDYQESEAIIQKLLKEIGATPSEEFSSIEEYSGSKRTPETYLGHERIENFASPESILKNSRQTYSLPNILPLNNIAYSGDWTVNKESAVSTKLSSLSINFEAQEVYLVMKPKSKDALVNIYLDNKPLPANLSGEDAKDSKVHLDKDRLYKLIKLPKSESHILKLEFIDPDTEVFAFTFG